MKTPGGVGVTFIVSLFGSANAYQTFHYVHHVSRVFTLLWIPIKISVMSAEEEAILTYSFKSSMSSADTILGRLLFTLRHISSSSCHVRAVGSL